MVKPFGANLSMNMSLITYQIQALRPQDIIVETIHKSRTSSSPAIFSVIVYWLTTSDYFIIFFPIHRESDRARQKEYQQYLRDLQARVEERPLLFEQESQVNARRKAERKYEEILREAGVDENIVKNLVTKEGNIIDAGSDDSGGLDEDYDVNKRQDETFTSDNFEGSLTGDDVRSAVIKDRNDKENYDNDLPKSDEDVSAVLVDDYDDDEL